VLTVLDKSTDMWGAVGCPTAVRDEVFCTNPLCERCKGKARYKADDRAVEEAVMKLRPAVALYIGRFQERTWYGRSNASKAAHSRTVRRLIERGLAVKEQASQLHRGGLAGQEWLRRTDMVLRITPAGKEALNPIG
jgi:hypothetical protein